MYYGSTVSDNSKTASLKVQKALNSSPLTAVFLALHTVRVATKSASVLLSACRASPDHLVILKAQVGILQQLIDQID